MVRLVFRGERRLSACASSLAFRGSDGCVSSYPPCRSCAFAPGHGRTMHAPAGSACAGKTPVDVAAPWPFTTALLDLLACRHACVFEGSSTGPHTFTYVQVRATLLTLTPIPDAFRSLPPGQAGLPLMGLSKDLPSIVQAAESVSRTAGAERLRSTSSALRDGNAGSHPRSVLVVSHHLDGLLLHDPATVFQAAADPGVHHVSFRCERNSPRCTYRPSKLSLRRQLRGPGDGSPFLRGWASLVRPSPIVPITAHLAPSSLSWTSRLCSIVGSVARPAVASRTRSVLPWACPIRPFAVLFASPHRER